MRRAVPALALAVLALGGCQLRYEVSLCQVPDGRTMIETMIDRPGDARIDRVAIFALDNDPATNSTTPDWEARAPDGRFVTVHRIPFGQTVPGLETRSPPLAFDPGRGYRIEVDGEWHGWLDHSPHRGIGGCGRTA